MSNCFNIEIYKQKRDTNRLWILYTVSTLAISILLFFSINFTSSANRLLASAEYVASLILFFKYCFFCTIESS